MKYVDTHTHRERERERERINNETDKIAVFDLLRLLACVGILFHHALYHPTKNHFFIYAGIPMEMFFFISGFLIPLSLERCNIRQFLIKRFFRLFPVLYLSIATYCFVRHNFNFKEIVSNLLLIGDFTKIGEIVGTSWSLKVEIKFYLLYALCCFLFKNHKKRLYLLVLFTMLVYAFLRPFGYHKMMKYVFGCLLGTTYYFLYIKSITKKDFVFLTIISMAGMCQSVFYLLHYYAGFFITILIINKVKLNKGLKTIKTFADLSYSCYLFHSLFLSFGMEIADIYLPVYLRNSTFYMFIYEMVIIIPCLCMCHFIYKYIEKPCYDFGRRLASRIK